MTTFNKERKNIKNITVIQEIGVHSPTRIFYFVFLEKHNMQEVPGSNPGPVRDDWDYYMQARRLQAWSGKQKPWSETTKIKISGLVTILNQKKIEPSKM